jgi:Ice-binding-like/PKD domain
MKIRKVISCFAERSLFRECGGGGSTNSAPIANAGPDQNIGTRSLVTLDGSGSSDANGDALTYNWSFTSMPARSNAVLSSATAVKPTFSANMDGAYVLSLVVNDGKVDSTPDTVTITAATTGPAPVSLGTPGDLKAAGSYVILTETSIANTPTSKIIGNIGISPGLASDIIGFDLVPLVPDATTVFSTSSQVTGSIFASDYASPTPANLTAAVASMVAAYNDAAGRPSGTGANLDLGSGTLTVGNLLPGTYTWSSFPDVDITGDITLTGTATDVWIFQIPGTLILESPIAVNLAGGALAQNIFWQVAGAVTIRTNAHLEGIILGQTSIILENGASITGRALAQSGVILNSNSISVP